ncbi:hypothetical protein NFH98_20810 [Halomonas sp. H33-56]|uniref:hypothetical protein n=1 Tax=Halomonas sp. H33-56 TaxID=2950873 RepID=UPI0032DF8C60
MQFGASIDIEGVEALRRQMLGFERQIPFATALALTRVAQRVKQGELAVMKRRFDRPTKFTMNSLYVKRAKKGDSPPRATVHFRDFAPKGTPADTYLQPQVRGVRRNKKRFEKALIYAGAMKPDEWAIPGGGARRDVYGNVAKGQITQVLSALRAFGEQGYQANATSSKSSRRKGNARRYFAGEVGGERGVWQRINSAFGEGVKPIFLFTRDEPSYRTRLPMTKIAENIAKANYDREFSRAIEEAIATAR